MAPRRRAAQASTALVLAAPASVLCPASKRSGSRGWAPVTAETAEMGTEASTSVRVAHTVGEVAGSAGAPGPAVMVTRRRPSPTPSSDGNPARRSHGTCAAVSPRCSSEAARRRRWRDRANGTPSTTLIVV